MVKNKIGGNKTKKKASRHYFKKEYSAEDLKKTFDQEYGYISDKLGDGRFRCMCYDKVKRLGILRGTLKRKVRLDKGDIVLVSKRDFQDSKVDIIAKFTEEEVTKLVLINEMTTSFIESGTCVDVSNTAIFKNDEKEENVSDDLLDIEDI